MRNLLLLVALLATSSLCAQRVHLIQLLAEPIVIPERDFYISSIIDARTNQEQIGTVQKGLANKKTPANFPTDFTTYLSKTIARMLPTNGKQTALLLKVNELRVSEQTTFSSERGTAYLNVDFLNTTDSLSYGNYTAEITKKGMDVTGNHDRRILDALTQVFKEFAVSDWQNTIPQAIATTATSWNYEELPPRALFDSFVDLKNNQPTSPAEFDLRFNKRAKNKHYVPRSKDGKKIKNVFVISNGEALYLNVSTYHVGDYFVKSQLLGRYAYFEDGYSGQGATIMFGAIGAAASYQLHSIVLDLETGNVIDLTEEAMDKILAPYPDLYQEFKNSKQKAPHKKAAIAAVNERLRTTDSKS